MNLTTETHYFGVDICKAKLDVHSPLWAEIRQFPNNPVGLRALLRELRSHPGKPHLVCEPTGGYEKGLLAMAFKHSIRISAINALRVRSFALASGRLAKTDKIDAEVLSDFGSSFKPGPLPPPCPIQQEISAVLRRRERLMSQIVREKNALEKASSGLVRRDIRASIAFLGRHLKNADREIERLIRSNETLRARRKRLTQIKGLGPQSAALLVAELPELGQLNDQQISNLVGVAPLNNDSGPRRGKRSIRGGRALVRRGLYMPAMCAVRFNPILREFYQRLIARNKPHHVAITAVIRKIIRLANRIIADPDFQPS